MSGNAQLAVALNQVRGGDTIKLPRRVNPTEDDVARAFAEYYSGQFVYDHIEQKWSMWVGSRWVRDEQRAVYHKARLFTRAVRSAVQNPPKDMAKVAFFSNVERAARADPKLAVAHEIWDRDPWLLGTPDGVVDLRTGDTKPNTPELYISCYTSVSPAPLGTPAPQWQGFLDQATRNDAEMQKFLQRLSGYGLTGHVSEEIVTFFYGPGGNGKGVFRSVVTAIMGDYALSVPIEVFTAGSRLNLEYYRAQTARARLVTASEPDLQATWSEAQIKEMTGNEAPLSAREPYGKPFTYYSRSKISIFGNYAPKLKGRSPAMERRLRIVPFNNQPKSVDRDLKTKLKAEYPAVLRWMIDGSIEWQQQGLGTAAAVKKATSNYFDRQDVLKRWIDERCDVGRQHSCQPSVLLRNYNVWARESGEDVLNGNAFAEMIERAGFKRGRGNKGRVVKGITLRSWKSP